MINAMLAGAIVMGALMASLFFLRFWRHTRDTFFLYFALSFALEALHRMLSAAQTADNPDAPMYYLIRLSSYSLILVAIWRKNRRGSSGPKR